MIFLSIAFSFMVLGLILALIAILFLTGTLLGALADSLPTKKVTRSSNQTDLDSSLLDGMSAEITASETSDIIPAETRIKSALVSKHGLYPHEVLVLAYTSWYYTKGNSFPGFWWYKYGVSDVDKILCSLLERGFLQIGDLQSAVENENATILKGELRKYGLKTGGKKAELVHHLLEEVPFEKLNARFSKRKYQLTGLGEQALKDEDYVLYIHRHQIEDLDIWSLNRIMHEPPYWPYRDKIWGYLNKRSIEHFAAGNFGLYRNCRYHMHLFLMEEKKVKDALSMLSEVAFYDLSGLGNNYDPQYLHIFAKHFFPYKNSLVKMAPGITYYIIECQKELHLTDEELKAAMLGRMNELSAPLQLFTPEECVEIVLMENHKDTEGLTKIYAKARQRFKQKYAEIEC